MDDHTPDISTFFGSSAPTGGVESTSMQGGSLEGFGGGGTSDKKKKQYIIIGIIVVVVVMVIGGLALFFSINSQQAAASEFGTPVAPQGGSNGNGQDQPDARPTYDPFQDGGIEDYLPENQPETEDEDDAFAQTEGSDTDQDQRRPTTAVDDQDQVTPGTGSRSRAPTRSSGRITNTPFPLVPSKTPVPSDTPSPFPTFPNNPPTQAPVARPTEVPWAIELAYPSNTISISKDLGDSFESGGFDFPIVDGYMEPDGSIRYDSERVEFTIQNPLLTGETYCIDTEKTFVAIKRSEGEIERLCDYFDEGPPLKGGSWCMQAGITDEFYAEVATVADPYKNCTDQSNVSVQPGTYVLKTEVFYNCDTDNIATCDTSKEVFSDEFTLVE